MYLGTKYIKSHTFLVAILLLAPFPTSVEAATGKPILIGCNSCETVGDFSNAINADLAVRSNSGDTQDAVYMVISHSSAKTAVAETWFESNPMFPGWVIPVVDMVTETQVEMLIADQYVTARAVFEKEHIGELPTVLYDDTYPNSGVAVGQGDWQNDSMLHMNSHPEVTMIVGGGTVPWSVMAGTVRMALLKLGAQLGITLIDIYVKLEFSDGSYGVFYVADMSTAGVHAVYYVDADENVYIIDPDLIDEVNDPALVDPDVVGDVDHDVPHGNSGSSGSSGGTGTWYAGAASTGSGAFNVTVFFPSTGGGRYGLVTIEDID